MKCLFDAEHPPEAGLLEPEGQAPPLAQDIRRDAHVLEEPAHGVLRLQAEEVPPRLFFHYFES